MKNKGRARAELKTRTPVTITYLSRLNNQARLSFRLPGGLASFERIAAAWEAIISTPGQFGVTKVWSLCRKGIQRYD